MAHFSCNLDSARARRECAVLVAVVAFVVSAIGISPHSLSAQEAKARPAWVVNDPAAGSEVERYLRLAQIGGDVPLGQFTVRRFSPVELNTYVPTGTHPWQVGMVASTHKRGWLLRPSISIVENTGFPFGYNDGPAWMGRGVSGVATGGAAVRWGWFSAQIAPVAWWSENSAFAPLPAGGPLGYGDFGGGSIDLPQRLSDAPLARLDPGESYVRLDAFGFAAGVSSAAEWWGPGVSSGVLFGNTAGGLPRVFAGTSSKRNIWIGDVNARVVVGRTVQSAMFIDPDALDGANLVTAGVVVFSPRGLPGLELGATRFFHQRWLPGGPTWDDVRVLWSSVAPNVLVSGWTAGNQLASVFGRVVVPGAGIEVYGEYARDDHNTFDNLDLITEPDHDALTMFGFQKRTGGRGSTDWWNVHAEVTNARMTHLGNVRAQVLFFQHSPILAGHTFRGQLLGSPFVRGGSGAEIGVDRYTERGRTSVRWMRQGLAVNAEGGLGYGALHTLETSALRFTTLGDFTATAGLNWRFGSTNEYDAHNINLSLNWQPPE